MSKSSLPLWLQPDVSFVERSKLPENRVWHPVAERIAKQKEAERLAAIEAEKPEAKREMRRMAKLYAEIKGPQVEHDFCDRSGHVLVGINGSSGFYGD